MLIIWGTDLLLVSEHNHIDLVGRRQVEDYVLIGHTWIYRSYIKKNMPNSESGLEKGGGRMHVFENGCRKHSVAVDQKSTTTANISLTGAFRFNRSILQTNNIPHTNVADSNWDKRDTLQKRLPSVQSCSSLSAHLIGYQKAYTNIIGFNENLKPISLTLLKLCY